MSNDYTSMTRYYREPSRAHLTPNIEDPTKGTYRLLRGTPKACLVTLTDGATVWFGIARCHEADTFSKSLARKMAAGRADTAFSEYVTREPEKLLPFTFDPLRLIGVCEFADLDQLLDMFYTLDKSIYRYLLKLPRIADEPAEQAQERSDIVSVLDDAMQRLAETLSRQKKADL